jgi:hypothetical protein
VDHEFELLSALNYAGADVPAPFACTEKAVLMEYLGDEDGDVIVMAHSKEKVVLGEMNMGSAVYGTIVPANGTLFLNNRSQLFAISASK